MNGLDVAVAETDAASDPAGGPNVRRLVAPVAVGAAIAAGTGLLAVVDPNQPGHYPLCPLYWLTGFYCPGCGMLRAIHDLAHLDLRGALGMNPLVFVIVPVLAWIWIGWLGRAAGWRLPRVVVAPWVPWLSGAVVLAFGILRNVPALQPYLAP